MPGHQTAPYIVAGSLTCIGLTLLFEPMLIFRLMARLGTAEDSPLRKRDTIRWRLVGVGFLIAATSLWLEISSGFH